MREIPASRVRPEALTTAPGFDDGVELTRLASAPASSMSGADDEDDEDDEDEDDEDEDETLAPMRPARPDGPRVLPWPIGGDGAEGTGPFDRPLRGIEIPRAGADAEENQADTNLDRPRAERRGGGGGPTRRSEEEEEESPEDEFKSDLLQNALGLEDSRLGLFGWVQGNYTGNPGVGVNGKNFGLIPNDLANTFTFQQIYLVAERLVAQRDQFDYGFRFDNLFGNDAQNFHDIGLLDRTFKPDTFNYDPVQFYGEIHLPIGQGIDVKGGRFFALAGYEDAQAPARPLLSTSDMFAFGSHPFTHFGVMTTWHVTERLNLYNGVVNGWNRWINDHLPWSYAGGVSWDSEDGTTDLTFTLNAGQTQFARIYPPAQFFPPGASGRFTPNQLINNPQLGNLNSQAVLFTTVWIQEWTKRLTTIVETDEAIVNDLTPLVPGRPNRHASYDGLAGWFLYRFTDKLTGVWRAEVFFDNQGLLTGFADTFYETTLGMIWKPRTWLWFRPEVRFDWAQFSRPYNNNESGSMFTAGFDTIFLF